MKRPTISRVLTLLLGRSLDDIILPVNSRIHMSDFHKYHLSEDKYEKGKFEYVYIYIMDDKIPKGQEFDIIFSNDDPLNFLESRTKILEIYNPRTGEENLYIEGYHNDCLVEFIEGVPDGWDRVAYVNADYAAPKRMEYTFTTKETMSRIVKLYKMYQLFEKLEEESHDNIIFAIDSIATNECYKFPEVFLQKGNNAFVCIEGVRAMKVCKGTAFDVIFTLDDIFNFVECQTKIINFYTQEGETMECINPTVIKLD